MNNKFESLADPCNQGEPLNISDKSTEQLLSWLKSMKSIRLVERCIAVNREKGLIGGPVHLGIGQEAVAVGVSSALDKRDRVFGAHRSHAHLLALGGCVQKLFAELLGKKTGHSGGMGGSMHLWDESVGFYGSVPIVAGTVPLAVGSGLAGKMRQDSSVTVCYMGDGAVEEGVVHEALNFASLKEIPLVFVIENNLFASHMDLKDRQPLGPTARFARANNIPFDLVDGNDVVQVSEVAARAVLKARSDGGPHFIEAITYRWLGHVDWREDIDVGVNRSERDLENWKKRDPIGRLVKAMEHSGVITPRDLKSLDGEIETLIDSCWKAALTEPYPDASAVLDVVFKPRLLGEH